MGAGNGQQQTLELEELNRQLADWEQRRDAEARRRLDECLSAELLFRRADRSVVNKTAFMRGLDGESPFSSRESRDLSVTVAGREARWMLEVWFNDDVTEIEAM